jgi:inhibitor of KinA
MALARAVGHKPFQGFIECVPSYSSLTIFYDVMEVRNVKRQEETVYEVVCNFVEHYIAQLSENTVTHPPRLIELPMLYDGEDLAHISSLHQLEPDEAIALHSSLTYTVFMIGFLPGFAYMGTVDERLETPRKATPRKRVPAGSVGIAGKQTGIYPQPSPGGWQLIGRTPLQLFDTARTTPCLLAAGDQVRFVPITKEQYYALNEY